MNDDDLAKELGLRAIHRIDQAAGAEDRAQELKRREDFLYQYGRSASDDLVSKIRPMLDAVNQHLPSDSRMLVSDGIGTNVAYGKQNANFLYSQGGGNFGHRTLVVTLTQRPSNFEAFGMPELDRSVRLPAQILKFEPMWVEGDEIVWTLGAEQLTPEQVIELVIRALDARQ